MSWLRIAMCWCGWHRLEPVGEHEYQCRHCRDIFAEEWVEL